MLAFLGTPPVQRTQEARVLVTAREMPAAGGIRAWMVPHLNGELRLEKPPLAYWLSAVAMRIGGVTTTAARAPFAIAGWLTVVVTFAAARRTFGEPTAWLTAAALIGSLLFARHARLAETDVLVTFFLTATILTIWRGADASAHAGHWFRLSGILLGLSILSKGAPAVFPLLFLVALSAARRDLPLVWRWVRSGAPPLAALVALPWFAYIISTIGGRKFLEELAVAAAGEEHTGWFFEYFPHLLRATVPWTGIAVIGIVLAIVRRRDDPCLRDVLLWIAAIFVPLCIAGQKQFHYLMPLAPPLAILCGWALHQAMRAADEHALLVRRILLGTLIVGLAAACAVPVIGRQLRGSLHPSDLILAAVTLLAVISAIAFYRRSVHRTALIFAAATPVLLMLLTQLWMPSLRTTDPRDVAVAVRAQGPGPYYFYGENISFPLIWEMRSVMPRLLAPADLEHAAQEHPALLAVAQTKSGRTPPPLPGGFVRSASVRSGDQVFDIYRRAADR